MFSVVVPGTAAMMYYGMEYGAARVRNVEREARMRFLATSISYAVRNYVVMGGNEIIGEVVAEALNKNIGPEVMVTKALVSDSDGTELYLYNDPPPEPLRVESVTAAVENDEGGEKTRLGSVRLEYYTRDSLENEKTHQIITIGNTLAGMFQVFYRNKALFQAKELMDTVRQDRNILYCHITGNNNLLHFSYRARGAGVEKNMTAERLRMSLSVNHARPIIIQDVAATQQYGKVIEASILIEQGNKKLGVVRIGYSLKSWTERVMRQRLIMSLLIAGLTALSLGFSFALARGISSPIIRLTRVARNAAGIAPRAEIDFADAERDVDEIAASFETIAAKLRNRNDEVGDLAVSFSSLILSLQHRVRELRQFYGKACQADRLFAMGQLSAGIAHEINNPLAIISTYVQLIGKRHDIDDELKGEISIIYEEINRIAEKVGDLMTFAQDSAIKPEKADLHDIARKTLHMMRHQFTKRSIEVVENFGSEPIFVNADQNKVKQVILNIALNALQSMDDGGAITLVSCADAGGGTASLSIKDSGYGISAEDLPRIFDPFFTRRKIGEGTGLGLAISYSIIKAHGGDIEVFSEAGNGAEFVIRLPVA